MRRLLFIALIGLVLISLLDWSVNNEVSRYQTDRQTNQYESATFSGPVFLGLRDGLAIAWQWIGASDKELLVIFTAVLAVVTIFLVKFTRGLMIYTRELWGTTNKLVEESRDTAKKELRAYLGIPDPGVQRIGVVNHFQVQVTITNSGRTPARDVRKWMRCRLVRDGEIISFDKGSFDPAKRSIAPDSKWNLRQDFTDWTDVDLNETRHFRSAVYVWGEVAYKDIYGEPHTTEFRLRSHATRLEIRFEPIEGGGVTQHQMIHGFDLEPEPEGNDLT